ncbi:MAG: FAD-binding protein [Rhizobiaceae bacterium]|nr:FAD-binding protein [Rhizobiaceae bacterium]
MNVHTPAKRSEAVRLIFADLQALLGERATRAKAVRDAHGHDESHHASQAPDIVVFARSTEEVAEIVRLCGTYRLPVIAFGAGTSLEGQVNAVCGGVCIDLSQMNAILRVSPNDFDCTVEAGVRRKQLNEHLRDTGLFFPIDPGPDATIGGMAATRASGTNAVRYGTMREAVLSLTVVVDGGRVIRTAQRARKSSAGYDLTRLFVGSEGTIGIITEITLRLHAIPETIIVGSAVFPDGRRAVDAAITALQLGVPLARAEYLDEAQIAAINRFSKLDLPIAPTLFMELHGSRKHLIDQMELLFEIVTDNEGHSFRQAESLEARAALWQARHDAYYAAVSQRAGGKGWATDVCVPVSRIAECIALTKDDLADCPVPACIVGHVGDGNFHVIFSLDPDNAEEMEAVAAISRRLVRRAISMDGTCTGEHGIGLGKRKYLVEEHGDAVELMRTLKAAYDPLGIFNPGKMLPAA